MTENETEKENLEQSATMTNPNKKKILGISLFILGGFVLLLALTKKKEKKDEKAIVININNEGKKLLKGKKVKNEKPKKVDKPDEGDNDDSSDHELFDELSEDDNSNDNNQGEK